MDYWQRRNRRVLTAVWSAVIVFGAGSAFTISWMLTSILSQTRDSTEFAGLLAFLLIPVYYGLFMLVTSAKSFISYKLKVRRTVKDFKSIPTGSHPSEKASRVWELVRMTLITTVKSSNAKLTKKSNPYWGVLADANKNAKLASGLEFDSVLLLENIEYNFIAGEEPGLGTWFAAPLELVESMNSEQLLVPFLHELFHQQSGTSRLRRYALKLTGFGSFANIFVLIYFFVTLIYASVAQAETHISLLPFLSTLLALWILLRVSVAGLVALTASDSSAIAADEFAITTVMNPLLVAQAVLKSLHYTTKQTDIYQLAYANLKPLARMMFVPIRWSRRGAKLLEKRILSLKARIPIDGQRVLNYTGDLDSKLETMAAEGKESYLEFILARPLTPRLVALASYVVLFAWFGILLLIAR